MAYSMYYLSIGAIFERDNSWLDEWILYHMGVGVEHFYRYNHDRDSTVSDKTLRPYRSDSVTSSNNRPTIPKTCFDDIIGHYLYQLNER